MKKKNSNYSKTVPISTTVESLNTNLNASEKDILILQLEDKIAQLTNEINSVKKNIDASLKNKNETGTYDFFAEDASIYKSLIDSSPDSILTLDLQNIIRFASLTDKNTDITTIVGHSIFEFVAADEVEKIKKNLSLAITSKQPQSYEIAMNSTIPRHFMTKVGPIIKDNEVVGLTLIARDISERKNIEKKLEESLSLLEATIESTADGILVADGKGKIILLNKKFIKLWGIPNEILSYKDDEMAIKYVLNQLVDPDSFLLKVKELYVNHDAMSFDILHFKNGRTFERYSQPQYVNNTYAGRVWSFRDVTERNQVEEALQKSQNNLEQAQTIAKIGSWEHNIKTGKLIWSKELKRIFDLENEPEETLYESYKNRIYPEDLTLVLSTLKAGLKTDYEYTIEHRIVLKNSAIKHIRGIGRAIFDFNNKVVAIKGTGQDITIEKEIQEKIKQSLLEKEILLKEIHHRVKNNLQIISSILNLQAGLLSDETTLNVLRDSQSRIRCMSLVHELLYNTTDFSSINLSEYTGNIVQNILRSYVTAYPIQLKFNVIEIYISLDIAISCGLIINELVTNAIKYAFVDGRNRELTIEISQTDTKVKLVVADNGIGLPNNFDYKNTESLGMQLVVSLVHQIDGEISLDTTSGTKFEITFYTSKNNNLN